MGWLMSWLEGIDWEQLLRPGSPKARHQLVNAVGAVICHVNIVVTASFALDHLCLYVRWLESLATTPVHWSVRLPEAATLPGC